MFFPVFLFILSFFLAYRSNFDIFFLVFFFLISIFTLFKLPHRFLNLLEEGLQKAHIEKKDLTQRFILVSFYVLSVFLLQKSHGLPDWFNLYKNELLPFFLLLYIPVVVILKLSPVISAGFALFFLAFSGLFFSQKNEVISEYLSSLVFLFLIIAVFQSLKNSYELSQKKI